MKLFIASLLFSLSLVVVVSAQGQIEGAFGQKLGALFDPGDAAAPTGRDSDLVRYPFTPVAPFKGLTNYLVDVSPTTHRVYGIYASVMAEEDSARQLATLLDIILREKYADDPPEPQPEGRSRVRVIRTDRSGGPNGDTTTKIVQRQAKRSVEVFCERTGVRVRGPDNSYRDMPGLRVELYYRDEAVAAEASKEAEVIKKEKEAKLAAETAVREKAAKEAWEEQQAEEARKRAEERVRLKEKATTLDTSGL